MPASHAMRGSLALLALARVSLAGADDGLPEVVTAPVETGALSATAWLAGEVLSLQDVILSAELAGRLVAVTEAGTRVEPGEMVARVDTAELELERRRARNALAVARLGLQRAQQRLARSTPLAAQQALSRAELDELALDHDAAIRRVEAARIELELAGMAITKAAIRAPFGGIVAQRYHLPGEYVGVAEPLLRVITPEHTEIVVHVPLDLRRVVRPGQSVRVEGGGDEIGGTIHRLVPIGDGPSRQFRLFVRDLGRPLPAGLAVRVAVPASAPGQTLTVPRDAIVLRERGSYVWVVGGDQSVHRVEVSLGVAAGDRVGVSGALGAGDAVVIRGAESLDDGTRVAVRGP